MYITKRVSYFLTACVLIAFLGMGYLFLHFRASENSDQLVAIEPSSTEPAAATEPTASESTPAPDSAVSEEGDESASEEQQDGFSLANFHRSETKDGKLLWEIVGKNATYHPTDKTVDIEQCIFSMRSDDDKLITLEAGKARLFLSGPDLTSAQFSADVTLHYGKEMKIITPKAKYNRTDDIVTTDDHVKVVGTWYMVEGDGLQAKLADEEYQILNNVQSVIEPGRKQKS